MLFEQVRVHVEGNRRSGVTKLLAHVNHVFALTDLPACERVPVMPLAA
jgi:hypothetical protein